MAQRGLGGNVRGGIRTILMVGAIVFFIVSMAVDTRVGDGSVNAWLALGFIFLTAGFLSESLDLNLNKKWE